MSSEAITLARRRVLTQGSALPATGGEFRAGWRVVLGCFAAAIFAWGFAAFGPGVYLAELRRQHEWPAAAIGAGTSLAFVVGALLLPWVGAAVERFGPRAVLSSGVLLIGLGAVGLSRSAALWQLYACNLLIGCGWAGASSTAISTVLAKHFDRRRGLALSLALTGASAGGFAVAPALVALSQRYGFQTAVPGLATVLLTIILPLVWLGIRRSGQASRPLPAAGGTTAPLPALSSRTLAMRDAQFWSVAAPFALAIAAQVGMMVVQVSYLLPLLGAGGTSLALSCTSIAGAAGRLVIGAAIDRLDQRLAAAATFATQACSLAVMAALPGSPAALYAGSIGFGLGMGNVVALPSLIIQREFAPSSFALALGLSTAIGQIAYALSPTLLGLVRDLTGDYRATLVVCIVLQAGAALLVLRRPGGAAS
jgi:MFS family permease